MPSTLLKTTTQTYSGTKLAQYVNDAQGTEFDTITIAIASLGIGVVSVACGKKMAGLIATALGLAIATKTVIDAILAGFDDSDLKSMIKKMGDDDSLKVTTKFYEWSSGGGSSYTYYTEISYSIV